jgi:hypothetical protein
VGINTSLELSLMFVLGGLSLTSILRIGGGGIVLTFIIGVIGVLGGITWGSGAVYTFGATGLVKFTDSSFDFLLLIRSDSELDFKILILSWIWFNFSIIIVGSFILLF